MLVGPMVRHSRIQSAIRLGILLELRAPGDPTTPGVGVLTIPLSLFTINELGSFSCAELIQSAPLESRRGAFVFTVGGIDDPDFH